MPPTTIFLVRHAAHDLLGRELTGRRPGVALGADGRRQAEWLAGRLSGADIATVLTSPLERARATADPIARRHGLPATIDQAVNEIDFGEWTGKTFAALADDPLWQRWNAVRSAARPPGGEAMLEAQARIVGRLERLRGSHRGTGIVVVSHGDMIKAALAHCLGMPLDLMQRIDIGPASISTVCIDDWGPLVMAVNEGPPR